MVPLKPVNMTSRDYTKEIDLDSGDRTIPLPYALPLLAAMVIAGWFGIGALLAHTKLEHPAQIVATSPAAARH